MGLRSSLRRLLGVEQALDVRLAAIERELRRQRKEARVDRKLALRTQAALDALLRLAAVPLEEVPYPQRLVLQRFGIHSQNGEDGILLALVRATATEVTTFAEIGCGTNGGNSGFLARELGWSGVMVDGSEANLDEIRLRFHPGRVRVVQAFVTRENVDALLRDNGLEGEIGVLSIDIDGNDLWVWEAVEAVRPRLVVVEYNAYFGPERAVAVPYDAERTYEPGSGYYGASLAALAKVSARKGYRLVATEPRGSNAFFVRDDLAADVPSASPADAFAPLLAPAHLYADPLGPATATKLRARERELERTIAERDLPLVEIG
jgi:hypothetical protein